MSSMYLLKDRPPAKKGDVVSVPFVTGQQMLADGDAVYAADKPAPIVEPIAEPIPEAKPESKPARKEIKPEPKPEPKLDKPEPAKEPAKVDKDTKADPGK